ncbi:lipase family protein, partial [Lysinibacillus sp. NPDC056185]|uniref:lipase family protein n=1 Tax=Lysinibacillus sp. NPDC056185 TaxID=3345739 RepID=UPI0039EDF808
VQTDYEGLGTKGEHPYLNGHSAANTVADIVRAARRISPRVGRDWIAMGHSQGGQAALFAASADQDRRDLDLLGAVALAPGGVGIATIADYVQPGSPGIRDTLGFLPVVLIGAAAADPAVDPDALLTNEMRPLLTAARTGGLDDVRRAAATVPTDRVLRPGADLEPLETYLQRQDPVGLTPRVPVMIAQGTADALVAKPGTDYLVGQLCTRTDALTYKIYPGADHRATVTDSLADTRRFVEALRAGRKQDSDCR